MGKRLIKVVPTSTRKSMGFVRRESGCSVETIETPSYPESPQGEVISAARKRAQLTLREAAAVIDVTAAEMSGLEWGRFQFESEEDADWAIKAIEQHQGQAKRGEG